MEVTAAGRYEVMVRSGLGVAVRMNEGLLSAHIAHSFCGNSQYFPLRRCLSTSFPEADVETDVDEGPIPIRDRREADDGMVLAYNRVTVRRKARVLMRGSKKRRNSVNECQTI